MRTNAAIGRPAFFALLVMGASLHAADRAAAQATDSPWTAWLGCWEPVAPAAQPGVGFPVEPQAATLCVLPLSERDVAELVTLENGSERDRVRVAANGARTALERDGCSGWESVERSADGRRLYRHSEFDCGGQLPRRTSSIWGFLGGGEWVEVAGVSVGDFTDVRVARYRQTTSSAETAFALEGRDLQIDAARTGASARVGFADVIDATSRVNAAVVEGWLIERNQGFELDADRLRELAREEVPGRVIDLMVALSYPTVFAINRNAREGDFVRDEPVALSTEMPRQLPTRIFDRMYDPYYGYGYGYDYDPYYRYGRYSRYGNWYGPPVIIVREPGAEGEQPQQSAPARLVNGRGFSRGATPVSGTSAGGTNNTGSPSTGSSAASGSSGSSGGGSSTPARTANPRTPE